MRHLISILGLVSLFLISSCTTEDFFTAEELELVDLWSAGDAWTLTGSDGSEITIAITSKRTEEVGRESNPNYRYQFLYIDGTTEREGEVEPNGFSVHSYSDTESGSLIQILDVYTAGFWRILDDVEPNGYKESYEVNGALYDDCIITDEYVLSKSAGLVYLNLRRSDESSHVTFTR